MVAFLNLVANQIASLVIAHALPAGGLVRGGLEIGDAEARGFGL
jgi:hypothetical protein